MIRNPATPSARRIASSGGDQLKFIILGGFVLFIFWAGVIVGMGFSHGHNNTHDIPQGLQILRHHQQQQKRRDPPVIDVNNNGCACQSSLTTLSCLSCRANVTEPTYCLATDPSFVGCKDLLNDISLTKLSGDNFYFSPKATTTTSIDFSAWVYLEQGGGEIQQMKTIASNRESGCALDEQHAGFALFVNTWSTEDRSLHFMFSSTSDSCEEVVSTPNRIPYRTWFHVRALLTPTEAKLFVNAELVASSRLFSNVSPALQTTSPLKVGAHAGQDNQHFFVGHIADVRFNEVVIAPTLNKGLVASKATPSAIVTSNVVEDEIDFLIPMGSKEELASGDFPSVNFHLSVTLQEESDALARVRREVVRNAMKHAYGSYETKAFGADEVMPKSGRGKTNWGGMSMTMVDALDTLWIMGLKDEFYRARDYIRDKTNFASVSGSISVFETTIRCLGGLMSAYDLSGDASFLTQAVDLGDRLSKSFLSTASGLPINNLNLNGGQQHNMGGNAVIAEVGTLQLEFRSLAMRSRQARFATLSEHVHTKMREAPPKDGLWPINVNLASGHSSGGVITFGAMGDSFFEYLIKVYHQGDRTEPAYLEDYERAMDGMHKIVVHYSSPNRLAYLADVYSNGGQVVHKMDHLACFVPAMLVLGIRRRGADQHERNARDLKLAKQLMYTCVLMYERQVTGIAPEFVEFRGGNDFEVPNSAPFYILRPETVESLYYLHQHTKHPVYRDWGHRIMMKIEKHCRLPFGYGALPDVRNAKREPDDRMESFFLAETLKYLFLLQDPDSEINLDEWVFNTEAHPLRVFPKTWRQDLGI